MTSVEYARETLEHLNAATVAFHDAVRIERETGIAYDLAIARERERFVRMLEGDTSIDERVTTADVLRARDDHRISGDRVKAKRDACDRLRGRYDMAILLASEDR